jgi:hypothetical protein
MRATATGSFDPVAEESNTRAMIGLDTISFDLVEEKSDERAMIGLDTISFGLVEKKSDERVMIGLDISFGLVEEKSDERTMIGLDTISFGLVEKSDERAMIGLDTISFVLVEEKDERVMIGLDTISFGLVEEKSEERAMIGIISLVEEKSHAWVIRDDGFFSSISIFAALAMSIRASITIKSTGIEVVVAVPLRNGRQEVHIIAHPTYISVGRYLTSFKKSNAFSRK